MQNTKTSKKPTIKDIARILGVSSVAVSRALRDEKDISAALKKEVRRVANEVGYIANASARNLASKKPVQNIGMIVPSIGIETAYNEVFKAISTKAAQKGRAVFLGVSDRSEALERKYCVAMCENRVGAIIMAPITSEIEALKAVCRQDIPLIFVGGKVDNEPYCVMLNYRASARKAVDHLHELGHRSIALFLYHPENNTIKQKREGYISAMQRHGLEPIVYSHGTSDNTYDAGSELILQLIQEGRLPTAIWCASDLMAMGVIDTLKNEGYRVPQDVSVVGHDNLHFGRFGSYNLTTFDAPKAEIGETAINIALFLMDELEAPVSTNVQFECELIVRGSSGPVKL
ncbi:MAG: LacI family DNA-binding transcriptional regulator [Clostridia bacterium]|nr:LacI family DNA-binding transcriptional regulator [Clostridia bacterium]